MTAMTAKIDSTAAPGACASASPVRPVTRSREDAATAAQTPARTQSQDSVALTGEAQTLQQLDRRVQSSTGVDADKVADIRRAISEGRYRSDPQAIAERLLKTETALG